MANVRSWLQSDMAKALLAVAIAQFAYWQVFIPNVVNPPSKHVWNAYEFEKVEVAVLKEPTLESAESTRYVPAELPYSHCCSPFYLSARYHFRIDEIPVQGIGIIKILDADNFILSVNGVVISAPGRMDAGQQTFHGQTTRIDRAPSGVLMKGENVVQFIIVRSGLPEATLHAPLIGEYTHLVEGGAHRLWVLNDYTKYAAFAAIIVGLIGLLILIRSDQKLFAGWLAINGFAWAFYTLFYKIMEWPFAGQGRLVAYFAITYFVPVALYCLIDSWTRRPSFRVQAGLLLMWLILVSYSAWRFFFTLLSEGFNVAETLMNAVLAVLAIAILVKIAIHFVRERDDRIGEISALSLCASALGFEAWAQATTGETSGSLSEVTPIFLVFLLAAFLNRNFHLFRSTKDINIALTSQLEEREVELIAGHERERELVRRQAHISERQRIIRDMHDGLGSQLMSMLLAAKRGSAEPTRVAEGLQSVIDEMRLIIDSMDSVGESLSAALLTFRERAGSRVIEAGWKFDWSDRYGEPLPDYPPRTILQIFRILQEAVTNALKHSGGDLTRVELTRSPSKAHDLRLTVSDNGDGLDRAGTQGRGIPNMEMRAKSIGGVLSISETQRGLIVTLDLPASRTGSDQHSKGMASNE